MVLKSACGRNFLIARTTFSLHRRSVGSSFDIVDESIENWVSLAVFLCNLNVLDPDLLLGVSVRIKCCLSWHVSLI